MSENIETQHSFVNYRLHYMICAVPTILNYWLSSFNKPVAGEWGEKSIVVAKQTELTKVADLAAKSLTNIRQEQRRLRKFVIPMYLTMIHYWANIKEEEVVYEFAEGEGYDQYMRDTIQYNLWYADKGYFN